MSVKSVRFTAEGAERAFEEWGCNCGPGAIAAALDLTLEEVRPMMCDFEHKHYTNPTLMWDILNEAGVTWSLVKPPAAWPQYGLARIQWEGPWTAPGVPPRVAYRQTHWVAAQWSEERKTFAIFDINAMYSGGWIAEQYWVGALVPWILESCVPRANGRWHLTHVVEIERAR